MERYRQSTRNKIIMAQEPTNLSQERSDVIKLVVARSLIRNGEQWGKPEMVQKGRRMLMQIRLRRLGKFAKRTLTQFEQCLMANRRKKFIQQVEEKRASQ